MQLVRQPVNSSLCGQACVAMIAGKKLSEVTKTIGHKKATYMYELILALKKLKINCPARHIELTEGGSYTLPDVAIVHIHEKNKPTGHYVVHYYGTFLDPEGGIYTSEEELFQHWLNHHVKYILPIFVPGKKLSKSEIDLIKEKNKYHVISCTNCDIKYKRQTKSKLIKHFHLFHCPHCGREKGKLEYKGHISL